MDKKNIFCAFFLFFFILNTPQVSAGCVSAFIRKQVTRATDAYRALRFPSKTSGRRIPSQLAVPDSMKIIANVDYPRDTKAFVHKYIIGNRVVEAGSGGFTELISYLQEQGAERVLSIDLVELKSGKENENIYLQGDIQESETIKRAKRILGGRADTIIVTSVFANDSIEKVAKIWITKLGELARPGGTLFLDFLLHDPRILPNPFIRGQKEKFREEFEKLLDELRNSSIIGSWKSAQNPIVVSYQYHTIKPLSRPRPPSITYKITFP